MNYMDNDIWITHEEEYTEYAPCSSGWMEFLPVPMYVPSDEEDGQDTVLEYYIEDDIVR